MTNIITTSEQLEEAVKYVQLHEAFAFDIETTGENRGIPTQNRAVWLSLATTGFACAIPFGHPNGNNITTAKSRHKNKETGKFVTTSAAFSPAPTQLTAAEVMDGLFPLLFGDQIKIGHGMKFDLLSLAKYYDGDPPRAPYADTIVMQWLLNENIPQKGLKSLTKKYYGVDYDKENVGKCVENFTFDKVGKYAYMDAKYTWLLYNKLLPGIQRGLQPSFDLEMQVLEVLLGMELNGVPIDVPELENFSADLKEWLIEAEGNCYKAAGKEFNINSVPQKQQLLFGKKEEGGQSLKPVKVTPKGAPSTDADSLSAYTHNDLAKSLLTYAEYNKINGTFVDGLLGTDEKERIIFGGHIYPDFVQYGTVTGRFSCRSPNTQQIPKPDDELGKRLRGVFIPEPGHKLIVADLGQIELVVLAHLSKDENLLSGFRDGIDAHTNTAAVMWGVPFDEVTKEMRSVAKTLNFCVVYGGGPTKVAKLAKVNLVDAKEFLSIHRKTFKQIYKFKDDVVRQARTRKPPYLVLMGGQKRRLPGLLSSNDEDRMGAERQAVNSLIQGSAAYYIKCAMIRLHKTLEPDMKMLMTVHDEIVMSVPTHKAEKGLELLKDAMIGKGIGDMLTVAPTVDAKIVSTWAEGKD